MNSPPIPFKTGYLSVGDGNEIYWEMSGNPLGIPALYLHGGPGGGISGGYRKHFDPETFLIVAFEQRGCGRSRPNVTSELSKLGTNTTEALIADIELLRVFLQVDKFLLLGISWGCTLALAYAHKHPSHVSALVLAAVNTTTAEEVHWITEGMRRIFPKEWETFAASSGCLPGEKMIDGYYRLITSEDRSIREKAAVAWCAWEDTHVSLDPEYKSYPAFQDLHFALPFCDPLLETFWIS
jgi:proline iminopeptidase